MEKFPLKGTVFLNSATPHSNANATTTYHSVDAKNIKYGDIASTEDVRLQTGSVRRETNLSSDDDMLDVNHHVSHHSDNNILSDCVRIDDASSHTNIIEKCTTIFTKLSVILFA